MNVSRRAIAAGAVLVCGLAAWPVAADAAAPAAGGSSLNRAGYVVTADAVHDLHAGWVQPTARCTSGATFADVQVKLSSGRQGVAAGTSADCHAGKPSYYAWIKFGSGRTKLDEKVEAGDRIRANVGASKRGGVSFSIVDLDQRWGEGGASGSGHPPHMTRASVLVSARTGKSGVLPLTDFGIAHFHGVKVDKAPFGGQRPVKVVMQTRGGVVKATPGEIRNDLGFPVMWKHA